MLLEGENLKVIIDDDGIGREASANLNRFKKKTNSFSSEANLNRIELLNEIQDLKIEQVIIDKKEGNQALGTRVEIIFPQMDCV
jgi:flagellar basal body P-ring protein FlgI